jgi:hypothetical protein
MSSIFQEILITNKERKKDRKTERNRNFETESSKSLTRSMQDRSRNKEGNRPDHQKHRGLPEFSCNAFSGKVDSTVVKFVQNRHFGKGNIVAG